MGGGSRFGRAALAVLALSLVGACDGGTAGLVGPTWEWTRLTEAAPLAHLEVPDPGRYTLTFADDGSFQAVADCNTVAGTYETDGDGITLEPGPSTLVACPDGRSAIGTSACSTR